VASHFPLRVLVSRVIALFRKGRLEQKLDKELRSHLERQVEENIVKLDAFTSAVVQFFVSSDWFDLKPDAGQSSLFPKCSETCRDRENRLTSNALRQRDG
jgi:hypothetical protein